MRVHSDQYRLIAADIAVHQRQVGIAAVHFALVSDNPEFPVRGIHQRLADTLHVALVLHPVADQFCHRQHF
jgi:cytochrome b